PAVRVLDDSVERDVRADHDLSHRSSPFVDLLAAWVEASAAQRIQRRIPGRPDVSACVRMASVTEQTLARARAGDEDAFRELTDPYRRELQLHVYRIVGSAQDAEDLLQETLLAAWRGLEEFEGRASVRNWLYRIATNRSLDALRASRRRPDIQRPPRMPEPTRRSEPLWLEPYRDVLGYRAAEAAEMLDISEAAVNSLLLRARAALESRLPSGARERAALPES